MSHNRDECPMCDSGFESAPIGNGHGVTLNTEAILTEDGELHLKIDRDSIRPLTKEEAEVSRERIKKGMDAAYPKGDNDA